jgi:hypothetical protein
MPVPRQREGEGLLMFVALSLRWRRLFWLPLFAH